MTMRKFLLAVFGAFAFLHCAHATESLPIGQGDLLHIQVIDTSELDNVARVEDDGSVPVSMVGKVQVAGMTPFEAAHAIEKAYLDGNLLRHPHVIVTVQEYATTRVSVLGDVKVPGSYDLHAARTVIDVLAMAGGLTETADRHILIERHGSKERINYFVDNDPATALQQNQIIMPGDTIIVPRAGIVYAIGDFGHPGGYAINDNNGKITALALIARAGGLPPNGAPAHAKLLRKAGGSYTQIALNLKSIQLGKQQDVELLPEDVIYVPFSYARNFAIGASSIVAAVATASIYRF